MVVSDAFKQNPWIMTPVITVVFMGGVALLNLAGHILKQS
jgi:hypothetical protein